VCSRTRWEAAATTRRRRRAKVIRTKSDKPLGELSEKALKQRIVRAERTHGEIEASDPVHVVREGKADENIERGEQAVETVLRAQAELARRAEKREQTERNARFALARRRPHPASKPLPYVASRGHLELRGCTIEVGRLTEDEGRELDDLVKRLKTLQTEEPEAKPLSEAEQDRYEAIVGKAAGYERLFETRRKETEAREKLAVLKDRRKLEVLPKRPEWAEPGSVTLPRQVFRWLQDSRDGAWTIGDIGVLAAMLGMFENRTSLIAGATFQEDEDGEPVLVCSGSILADIRFTPAVNNAHVFDDEGTSGRVREAAAILTLHRNRWLEIERMGGTVKIRLGERARKLR
jgi:hypothetical protein